MRDASGLSRRVPLDSFLEILFFGLLLWGIVFLLFGIIDALLCFEWIFAGGEEDEDKDEDDDWKTIEDDVMKENYAEEADVLELMDWGEASGS